MKEFFDYFKDVKPNIVKYGKDSMIFSEDEVCTSFSLILDGSIQIKKISPEGNILIVAEFNGGDSIGESLVFGSNNKFPMSGFAKVDTTILNVSKEDILYMCQYDLEFLSKFLRTLSDKSLILSKKLTQLSLKTIRQKICEYVLKEHYKQESLEIKLNVNKTELADKMGILRPSLYRELNNLRDESILDYDRKKIYILDLDKVRLISMKDK